MTSFDYQQYSCSTISYFDIEDEYLGDNQIVDQIQIFPNPFNDDLYLRNIPKDVTIKMYDLRGAEIKINYDIYENRVSIIDDLNSGIYILSITSDINLSTIKLVKQ